MKRSGRGPFSHQNTVTHRKKKDRRDWNADKFWTQQREEIMVDFSERNVVCDLYYPEYFKCF